MKTSIEYASYPFAKTDAYTHNRFHRIIFTLPNGKVISLDGINPESLAKAANEMYEKIRLKCSRKQKLITEN